MDKKVLIIAYHFPPVQGVASRRSLGLAKYIKKFGWEPVILTAKTPRNNDSEFNIAETEYPGNLEDLVSFAFSKKLSNNKFLWELICFPDAYKNWKKRAIEKGKWVIENNKIDAIISISGPETAHLAGKELNKKYNIPWIADMRDLWTLNYIKNYSFPGKIVNSILEKRVLSSANAVTTVSDPYAKKQSEFLNGKKVYTIENGFDPEELNPGVAVSSDKLTFIYTGIIYEGHQHLEYFFRAIKELLDERLINQDKVCIDFYGPVSQYLEDEIKRFDLANIAKYQGLVPKEISIQKQRESQVLLLLNLDNAGYEGAYSGKIFEYLAAKKPILATGKLKTVVTDLLDKTDAGIHAIEHSKLKEVILDLYNEFLKQGHVTYRGKQDEINKFSHVEMAGKFAAILDRIVGK